MVSVLPIIDCDEIGSQISEATLKYFSNLSHLERSTLIIDLSENLRMSSTENETQDYWSKTKEIILSLLAGVLDKF